MIGWVLISDISLIMFSFFLSLSQLSLSKFELLEWRRQSPISHSIWWFTFCHLVHLLWQADNASGTEMEILGVFFQWAILKLWLPLFLYPEQINLHQWTCNNSTWLYVRQKNTTHLKSPTSPHTYTLKLCWHHSAAAKCHFRPQTQQGH